MSKISDKTKLFLIMGLIEGLKKDLEHRLIKCPDCKWTLEYINYILNFADEKPQMLPYGNISIDKY